MADKVTANRSGAEKHIRIDPSQEEIFPYSNFLQIQAWRAGGTYEQAHGLRNSVHCPKRIPHPCARDECSLVGAASFCSPYLGSFSTVSYQQHHSGSLHQQTEALTPGPCAT